MNALQQQLQNFGLNPRQWILRKDDRKIRVIHRTDSSLVFEGTCAVNKRTGLPQWQNLRLAE